MTFTCIGMLSVNTINDKLNDKSDKFSLLLNDSMQIASNNGMESLKEDTNSTIWTCVN